MGFVNNFSSKSQQIKKISLQENLSQRKFILIHF